MSEDAPFINPTLQNLAHGAAEKHLKAAHHHEQAAEHHRKAAAAHKAGLFERARAWASHAFGHGAHAHEHATDSLKEYAAPGETPDADAPPKAP